MIVWERVSNDEDVDKIFRIVEIISCLIRILVRSAERLLRINLSAELTSDSKGEFKLIKIEEDNFLSSSLF